MKSFKLVFVIHILTFGSTNSQFNYFNPSNPFLNTGSNSGQNLQQNNQKLPQNAQNYQQDPQNRPNYNQNPFFSQNFLLPSKPPQHHQPDSSLRLSEQKCNEYFQKSKSSVPVGSLALFPSIQAIETINCDTSQGLIIGGENANTGEFPHMAAIGYKNLDNVFTVLCGGSLISEQFVLTAAHCKKGGREKPTLVRLGDLNLKVKDQYSPEQDVRIESFINHENYDPNLTKNDIAVIKLVSKVILSKNIRPACLMTPTGRLHSNKVIATGWGNTNAFYGDTSDILQKVELSIISNSKCRRDLDDETIDSTQLCAGEEKGGKDTCRGDSGGPLQIVSEKNKCLYVVIGITSYGNTYCGSENSPGVYTKVSAYIDWIEKKVWGSS